MTGRLGSSLLWVYFVLMVAFLFLPLAIKYGPEVYSDILAAFKMRVTLQQGRRSVR